MRCLWNLAIAALILSQAAPVADAVVLKDTAGWQRVDSRFCTVWVHPELSLKKINRKISTRWIHTRFPMQKKSGLHGELATKCDMLFRRAEELLDMYPAGVHVTVKVAKNREDLRQTHQQYYGQGTDAIAFYHFPNNTIYIWGKKISESVLIHEMAHSIIDHFFQVRPPRKIEEMLAVHVNKQMRD